MGVASKLGVWLVTLNVLSREGLSYSSIYFLALVYVYIIRESSKVQKILAMHYSRCT